MFDQHLLFLSKFVKLFNKYDPDQDGVLNQLQFRNMMDAAGLAENTEKFFNILDVNQEGRFLFTKCV
jgi:Ca2+-binding EF-hand superfamily protein